MTRSPLAPPAFPTLPAIDGVQVAVGRHGVKYRDRDDLLLVALPAGTTVAGAVTRSATAAAPVHWCRAALTGGNARALVVNAGNANAFTGAAGMAMVRQTAETAAALLHARPAQVFVASTGVIGEPLPPDSVSEHLPALVQRLGEADWPTAAAAIMTTDTFSKGAGAETRIGGRPVRVAGIAKGSGMIAPDMATMLAFLFTDAALPAAVLQAVLAPANARSFNSITVDGDTSTSDTVLLFATGRADHASVDDAGSAELDGFRQAISAVMGDLARQVVCDGEGASKLITVTVHGAVTEAAAHRIGLSIANSPLVKTAIAGSDANWGRIVMAAGKAGETLDQARLGIAIGGIPIARAGAAVPAYDEAPVARHMAGRDIDIVVDLGLGTASWTVWTCDLTHGYIDINASYRS